MSSYRVRHSSYTYQPPLSWGAGALSGIGLYREGVCIVLTVLHSPLLSEGRRHRHRPPSCQPMVMPSMKIYEDQSTRRGTL